MSPTINSSEITAIIKSKIENYSQKLEVNNVGSVIEISDGISRIYGLKNVMSSELVEFDPKYQGVIDNLLGRTVVAENQIGRAHV